VLVVVLAAAGCGGSDDGGRVGADVEPSPNRKEIVLAVGDEVRVDALLRLGFSGVPHESRCPTTVICPWTGDGAAEVVYTLGEGPSYPDTLHTALGPKSAEFGGYTITLLDLMPYPDTPDPIPLDEYAIRIEVERVAP
jgi:hypothetical protein